MQLEFAWDSTIHGLPRWLSGKESAQQCRRHKKCGCNPWVGKIPWRREWLSTWVFLPGEFHGWRSLVEYTPWSHRVRHNWATNKPLHLPLPGLFFPFCFVYTDLAFCFGFWPASACKSLFSVCPLLHFHFHALEKEMATQSNPIQCSCLENPRNREAWWAAVYGVTQSWRRLKQLSSSMCLKSCPASTHHPVTKLLPHV